MLEQAMTAFGVDMDTPFEDLSEEEKHLIFYGSDGKSSISIMKMNLVEFATSTFLWRCYRNIKRRYHETNSDYTRTQMRLYMNELTCGTCHGYRLNDQALSVRVGGEKGPHIGEISDLSIADHLEAIDQLTSIKKWSHYCSSNS